MKKASEIPSVHPSLDCAAEFIADMEHELAGNPALLLSQKRALKAIGTVILMLRPMTQIILRCPKANLASYYGRQAIQRTETKK